MKKKTSPKRLNKKAIVVGVVLAVVIIGGSAIAFLPASQNNPKPSTQSNEFDDIFKKLTRPVVQNASALGSNTANITIVEFGDYKCQYCARFHRETKSQLIDNFVDTGQVKFMFKDFVVNDRPLDKQSTLASRASYCAADQGKYWQYHDEVYDNSKGEDVGWVTKEILNRFALNVQVPDLMKFSECVDSQKYNDVVAQNNELARSLGVSATPTFLIIKQGRQPEGIEGAQPYNSFQEVISQLQKS
ncbi:MAG: thioredoxin domain-containing protein [Nitrososphaeraceae archaeon]